MPQPVSVRERTDLTGALLGTNDAEFRARVVPILRGSEKGIKELNCSAMGFAALNVGSESALQGPDFTVGSVARGSRFAFPAPFINPGVELSDKRARGWMGEDES